MVRGNETGEFCDLSTSRETIVDFLMEFAGEVIEVLEGFQTVISGNLWPLAFNDQPQLERERIWTVLLHRRDPAASRAGLSLGERLSIQS
jgi:hypothetical protein